MVHTYSKKNVPGPLSWEERADRYLKIVEWLKDRYSTPDDKGQLRLILSIGEEPSRYRKLEEAFWRRYIIPTRIIIDL